MIFKYPKLSAALASNLNPDHTKMKEAVKSCEILEEVEKVTGSLE